MDLLYANYVRKGTEASYRASTTRLLSCQKKKKKEKLECSHGYCKQIDNPLPAKLVQWLEDIVEVQSLYRLKLLGGLDYKIINGKGSSNWWIYWYTLVLFVCIFVGKK